jgi:hypothetical protein
MYHLLNYCVWAQSKSSSLQQCAILICCLSLSLSLSLLTLDCCCDDNWYLNWKRESIDRIRSRRRREEKWHYMIKQQCNWMAKMLPRWNWVTNIYENSKYGLALFFLCYPYVCDRLFRPSHTNPERWFGWLLLFRLFRHPPSKQHHAFHTVQKGKNLLS